MEEIKGKMEDCHTDSELLTQFQKNTPQLRFSGFGKIKNGKLKGEKWHSMPASEIFITVNDRNHPNLPVLSASQELGMIFRDEGGMNISHDKANEVTYKRVLPGQFVIHLRSFQGGFAHSKVEGITSPAYTILDFKNKDEHFDLYWKYVFSSEEFIKRLELITYGIRDGRSINFEDFSTLNFYFPSYEVQQKIGTFLTHIDSLIQAKTKKLESLKAVKKSLLQKCFPKVGEKVPEMRFAGFSGDWEEKELADVADYVDYRGKTPDKVASGIQLITARNIRQGYIDYENNKEYVSEEDYTEVMHRGLPKIGDVLITTEAPCGYVAQVNKTNIALAQRIIKYRCKKDDNTFLCYNLLSERLQKELDTHSSGGTVKGIKGSVLHKIRLFMPQTLVEQQKIGQFFSKYDSLISAQQKEIDKLKEVKKALLQKMFV